MPNRAIIAILVFFTIIIVVSRAEAFDANSSHFKLNAAAIDSIAGSGASASFKNTGAGGQLASGLSTNIQKIYSGILYWLYSSNHAPLFTIGDEPREDPISNSDTPTEVDANVTFKARATDAEGDGWYLAICKGEGIIPGTSGTVPSCTNGTWAKSSSFFVSGSEITLNYKVTASEVNDNYVWYAYACDNNIKEPLCSPVSNSGTGGGNGSPFNVHVAAPPVVITNPTQSVTVVAGSDVINPTINIDSLTTDNGTATSATLPAITLNVTTSLSTTAVNVAIPSNTEIMAPTGWNGIINAPQVKPNSSVTVTPDSGKTVTISSVIEIGSDDIKLTFDKAVRILMPGQSGKYGGYYRSGVFTKITNTCSSDTQTAGNALGPEGDCKIDVGSDMIIWTKHFTSFVTYTQTTNTDGGSSGSGSSGSGSSGGGGAASLPSTVTLSGRAYPLSQVTILKDGQIAATTIAGPDASFKVSLAIASSGNYIIAVYGEDSQGIRSNLFTFPMSLATGSSSTVNDIFIAPTITIDKTEVKRGDTLVIFGQSSPNAEMTIEVNSENSLFFKTIADSKGAYLSNFDTSPLEVGQHLTRSKAAAAGKISPASKTLSFAVNDTGSVLAPTTPTTAKILKGDLNKDGRVNLIDFSIAAYWYKRTLSTASSALEKERLNGDGKIDLIDFSIMAYYWTG
ncbi:MAG: dockerin type I repeat-containing protein [Candidatus Falkowbacteria bacterium]|nr:dockerin type I repeat-containing protein [Candidatus Falkowbacteria bacterium]